MADEKKVNPFAPDDATYEAAIFEDGGNLTVDLTGVQELKFENIPKGIYPAVVDDVKFGMSQSSGKPMLTVTWKISEGQYEGRTLIQFLSFSQGAIAGTKASLARFAPELMTQKWDPASLTNQGYFNGKTAKIRVDIGEYNGEERSQIKGLIADGGGQGDSFLGR